MSKIFEMLRRAEQVGANWKLALGISPETLKKILVAGGLPETSLTDQPVVDFLNSTTQKSGLETLDRLQQYISHEAYVQINNMIQPEIYPKMPETPKGVAAPNLEREEEIPIWTPQTPPPPPAGTFFTEPSAPTPLYPTYPSAPGAIPEMSPGEVERFERATEAMEARRRLEETIASATQRLAEIEKELAEMDKVETFSVEELKQQITKILKAESKIKNIKEIRIIPNEDGNGLYLFAQLTAKISILRVPLPITTDIHLSDATLVNSGNNIRLNQGYSLTATKGEDTVRKNFDEKIDSLGEEIKNYIEEHDEKKRKVEKIEIVDGKLKVTFK